MEEFPGTVLQYHADVRQKGRRVEAEVEAEVERLLECLHVKSATAYS